MFTEKITSSIHSALSNLQLPSIDFAVDYPTSESHGDYATNVALLLFPKLKSEGIESYANPRLLAEAITQQLLNEKPEEIESIVVAGPGFINFTLNTKALISILPSIIQSGNSYGHSTKNQGKNIIVEYSSPNIAKPFTIGHLRSTIIGDAIANLKAATGWQVFRDNHLGDWGTQFGKQIYAIKTWGDEAALDESTEPVKLLVDLYVKFHQEAETHPEIEDEARAWFKRLEDGDEEARRLWKKCIDWSWKEFTAIYQELGVVHTENEGRGYGESYFEDKMTPVIDELTQKNLLTVGKEGAKIVEFEDNKLPPLMILKKDGATLYATRDLACDKFRKEKYGNDITIINEVGIEQSLYFQQLYTLEVMLGWFNSAQRTHVGHGHYRFQDSKMSTRKGNVIWLSEVIKEAKNRSTATEIAIGALKYNDLKRKPQNDVIFDWDELLNMEGNSGPYLQYTCVRCASVIAKSNQSIENLDLSQSNTLNPEELTLLKWLTRFPEIVEASANNLAPHALCEYIFEVAQRYNTFYNTHSILGHPDNELEIGVKNLRLSLTAATKIVLINALTLLGIKCPEKM